MNSAVKKINPYPEYDMMPQKAKRTKKPPQAPKRRERPKNSRWSKFLFFVSIAGVFVLGLFILQGYANITSVRAELSKQEAQIEDLEKKMTDLSERLESIKSSSRIEEAAMYKLGLVYPDEDQIVKVNVPKPTELSQVNQDEQVAGRVKTVLQFFSGAF